MQYEEFLKLSERCKTDGTCRQKRAAAALESYRVKNAVLMAAGYGSRLAPITDKTPKGLLRIRGEVLVERQMR